VSKVFIRSALIVATIVVLSGVVLAVANPIGAAAVIMWLSGYPTQPPPIVEGVVTRSDWPGGKAPSEKVTVALQQRFPVGSDARALFQELLKEGFKDSGIRDGARVATFSWGNAVCGQILTVMLTADGHDRLASIKGYYSTACL
jgi:hypothetical protein